MRLRRHVDNCGLNLDDSSLIFNTPQLQLPILLVLFIRIQEPCPKQLRRWQAFRGPIHGWRRWRPYCTKLSNRAQDTRRQADNGRYPSKKQR